MPKGPGTGSCRHEKNLCGRNDRTDNVCCVPSRKHSFMTTEPRSRCVSRLPGLRTRSRRSRASAKPTNLTFRRQSVVRGLRRDGCMGAIGRPARSLAAKCQTNLVFPAGSASFGAKPHRRSSESWTVPAIIAWLRRQAEPRAVLRCLARAKHRGLLLVLGDMRSIAPILPVPAVAKPRGLWYLAVSGEHELF